MHSNSWGGGYWYDSYCMEVDEYLFENQDVAIFFAAGNDGSDGVETVLSPALSKNGIAVGCTVRAALHNFKCPNQILNAASFTQMNNVDSGGDTINHIAYFSAHGPSPDGRIKPDILAPGYSINSVAAVTENNPQATCALEWKAGTSMVT